MDEPEKWGVIGVIGAAAGALIKTIGDRLRARDKREISERDLWAKLQAMERRLDTMSARLDESRRECANLRLVINGLEAANASLRDQLTTLAGQYRALKAEHEALTVEAQEWRRKDGKGKKGGG